MSTGTTLEIVSSNLDDTLRIGEKIGRKLRGGECLELKSDLGGGKTVLVRGLARGMASKDQVASPSFTISRHYTNPSGLTIYHYDFYRLNEPGVILHEIQENLGDKYGVVVIEWSDVVKEALPEDRLRITIQSTGEDSRHIVLEAGKFHQHLIEGLR